MITTILVVFFVAFLISLAATPFAAWFGRLAGAVDNPDARKVHKVATPRSGGAAIFVAFVLTALLTAFLGKRVPTLFVWDTKTLAFFAGAFIVFATGFADDLHRLGPRTKFLLQVAGATVAFAAGLRINVIPLAEWPIHSLWLSYGITVFWFVLLINAINLIDGLDGLAGGITFLSCSILTILLVLQKQYVGATYFAVMAGSILGFLRYNFSPASVFMGDGGSYFIGYAIAGLSIMGSTKTQTSAVMLILALAMGVPLFDTALSPLRRFIVGKRLFQPDRSHIHHKLIAMGLSTRKVVLVLYAISAVLCACAVLLVNAQNSRVGLFIVVIGAAAFAFTRKLGYFRYPALHRVIGWLKDLSDVTGLSNDRRRFFGLQLEISQSRTMDELWVAVCNALGFLNFARADFWLTSRAAGNGEAANHYEGEERRREGGHPGSEETSVSWTASTSHGRENVLHWARGRYRRREDVQRECMLKIEIPLMNGAPAGTKTLFVLKDANRGPIDDITLRRVWQLSETMIKTIEWIEGDRTGARVLPGHGNPEPLAVGEH